MSESVERARVRLERELAAVRTELDREWGWAPKGVRWVLPVAAVVAGFLAGENIRRRLRSAWRAR